MPAKNYFATIALEHKQYVARDDDGNKRAWGDCDSDYFKSHAAAGRDLALYLFHAEEVGTVEVLADGKTRVEILTY